MSVNRFQPHVLVLPEDDANSQLANGFWLFPSLLSRRMQVLPSAGGWHNVMESFVADHADQMRENTNRSIVLLIDFDEQEARLTEVKAKIPEELAERVFVIGVLSEPEALRRDLRRSYETIGSEMAKDCRDETNEVWGHALLRHNATELERLREHVRPILFA
jgi:hypothetical protein